ncbi:MAG TPA: NAD(P)-dependent oxidoreductase [Opitutaceae bacterium]|nr:NAD(P)-dependent oxidoreductase [Opitutaceae bacterium]
MKTIGVIGLGIIGGAWAKHYAVAGVLAGCWNRTPQPTRPQWKDSPEAVADAADAVQIVVADPPAVQGVLDRILPRLGPGKIVIQSSTIDPDSSDRFRAQVEARGARYLEAPFTGSKPAAEQRKTVYYLGGPAEVIAAVQPLLELVSETRLTIAAEPRKAAALKLAMNLNLAVMLEGLCEALTFVRRAGISDDIFFDALAGNAGNSPFAKLKESKLRTGDFSPQFSVKHMHKDMRLASATTKNSPMPMLEAARERLQLAENRGWGDEDLSAVLKLLS